MSTLDAGSKVEEVKEKEEKAGELLFCGATCWDIIGRKKGSVEGNLVSPTRLRPLVGVDIRFVAAGCSKFLLLCSGVEIFWVLSRFCSARFGFYVRFF